MKKGIFFSLAAALMLCFGACNPDDTPTNNNGNGNDDSNSLVGSWQVDNMTYNGQEMTPPDMVLVMNANGTGDVLMGGQSENNNFTWSVNGNVLTVHPNGGGEYSFTIVSISSTEASLTGNVVPGTDMQGDVTMHLTKINGGGNDDPTDPPAGDFPVGTQWIHSESGSWDDEGITYTYTLDLVINFTTATNGIIAERYEVTVYGQTESDNEEMPFTYTYNSSSNSGTITVTYTDEDTGETETETTPFTYNASNNTLVVVNDVDPETGETHTIVFQRANK